MRIMVVEEDEALGLFLKKGLAAEGHDVRRASCREEALVLAEQGSPDLLVSGVAGEEGIDLLTTVHRDHPQTSILALTLSLSVEERVRCLNHGADDCMAKPFSFQELTARCRALLRRQGRCGEIVLSQGSLSLNRIARSATFAGHPVSLTTKEFRLLEFLLQNAGRCCSRSELLTRVFDLPAENATNVVDVYINYLRRKLSGSEDPPLIETVRGAGYRLARARRAPVAAISRSGDVMHVSA